MANPARIKLGLIAALCLAIAALGFLIATPGLLDKRAIRTTLVERLATWTGASVTVGGPVTIRYFPRPMVELDDVRMTGIRHLPAINKIVSNQMHVRLGLWSLFSADPVVDRITFIEPVIEATAQTSGAEPHLELEAGPSLFDAISKAPVDQIVIENGTVTVSGATPPETFSGITTKINLEPGGEHLVRGTTTWRKQPLVFSYEGGALGKKGNISRMPVTISLSGALVSAEIKGHATVNNNVRMDGALVLQIPNLPRFARWTGVLVPEDQKRGEFSAEGTFHWTGHRIGFDEGTFTLDGNRALGALALDFGKLRPKIDGTLALQRLDLAQYFEPSTQPNPDSAASKDKAVDLDFPVLHHVNFDLRISTTDLIAEPLRLGQAALSVTLDAGKLVADVAVFELCGGTGNSRIELDATVPNSEIRLSTSLNGISARSCIEMFAPASPLDGTASITADLTSSGRTAPEILDMLRGKANVTLSAGSMAVNIDNLIAQMRKQAVDGWKSVRDGSTAFKLLKGDIFLRANAIYSDSIAMDLGNRKIVGEGTVDFGENSLDIQMGISEQTADAKPIDGAPAPPVQKEHFVIKGPWSQPSFSLGQRKSSAHHSPLQADIQTAERHDN